MYQVDFRFELYVRNISNYKLFLFNLKIKIDKILTIVFLNNNVLLKGMVKSTLFRSSFLCQTTNNNNNNQTLNSNFINNKFSIASFKMNETTKNSGMFGSNLSIKPMSYNSSSSLINFFSKYLLF